ncbi:E3 ubiquitin-protein ligase siah-1 [Pseudolycoriella hygida]|uniref:E3 ubiquitin-protein ligase n=1 Tax=Pseudolycoriella hygida TaxID=35572 RepID=A0A9Q0S9S0_9DIPT|nr:E3 ubiquitin-protein ligase siah-1 [Pseudolycoriella hygida]
MTLDKYKCEYCRHIEDNVYKCTNSHLICEKCSVQFKNLCKGERSITSNFRENELKELVNFSWNTKKIISTMLQCKKLILSNIQTNPIQLLVKYETKPCLYHAFGCNLQVMCDDVAKHTAECQYRPYKCVGEIFGLWTCEWTGRQLDLPLHMNTNHKESLGDNFEFFQKSSVSFNPTESWKSINLVKAYGKHFIYYMYSDSAKRLIYFIIYLLGFKEDAKNYLIDFEIISKSSSFEKIKFVSRCYSDTENIPEVIESEKCAVLTHNTLKHFVKDGELHFRFIIKRKDDDEFTKKKQVADNVKVVTTTSSSKPAAHQPPKNKGTVKVNDVKKTGTIPSIIQPVLKPLQTDSALQISLGMPTPPPHQPQRSSINAVPDKELTSPCYSPSINKDDEKEVRRSDILKRSLSTGSCTSPLPPVQPYKNIDDKLFRRRYPENCLTKPAYRK